MTLPKPPSTVSLPLPVLIAHAERLAASKRYDEACELENIIGAVQADAAGSVEMRRDDAARLGLGP